MPIFFDLGSLLCTMCGDGHKRCWNKDEHLSLHTTLVASMDLRPPRTSILIISLHPNEATMNLSQVTTSLNDRLLRRSAKTLSRHSREKLLPGTSSGRKTQSTQARAFPPSTFLQEKLTLPEKPQKSFGNFVSSSDTVVPREHSSRSRTRPTKLSRESRSSIFCPGRDMSGQVQRSKSLDNEFLVSSHHSTGSNASLPIRRGSPTSSTHKRKQKSKQLSSSPSESHSSSNTQEQKSSHHRRSLKKGTPLKRKQKSHPSTSNTTDKSSRNTTAFTKSGWSSSASSMSSDPNKQRRKLVQSNCALERRMSHHCTFGSTTGIVPPPRVVDVDGLPSIPLL